MGTPLGTLLVTLSLSLGQFAGEIGQEDRDFQNQVFRQWWGNEIVWKFDELPTEGSVAEARVPYSGYIYPDTAGGTMSGTRKYDLAFHGGELLATAHERADTSTREIVNRPVTYTQRFGLFGGQVRNFTVMESVNATPAWYGHCNGWTSAAIRHAEPQKEVEHKGVVFTPADIKALLAEIYMYNDPQMLAGDGTSINPGVLHVILANWLGHGSHPIGIETDPGKEKWNYPVYGYSARTAQYSPQYVDVAMNITYAMSSRGEFQGSPRIPRTMYFHYRLELGDEGQIIGGLYYRDSSRIDMLWVPLRAKPSGAVGNERGNPHIDVDEVLAIWRKSVPDELRRNWVIVDPPNNAPSLTAAESAEIAEGQTYVLQAAAADRDLAEGLAFVAAQQLVYSISGGADGEAFAIDAEAGELSFAQLPNYERPADVDQDNIYQVEVTVEDGAGGSDTRLLRITVTDTNDAPVMISKSPVRATERQVKVLTVSAEDEDAPDQTLKYLLCGGEDRSKFAMNNATGELTFKRIPDFENPSDRDKDNEYEVEVQVQDGAGGTDTQLLSIAVSDANDPPIIVSKGALNFAEGQLAAPTVAARDEDVPTQTLTFSLRGGPDRKRFAINPKTGELTFKQMPNFEIPTDANGDNIYEVRVRVADGAGGASSQTIRVAVTDVNDAPVITSDSGAEATENQLAALIVAARDEDLPNQTLTRSLVGGADRERFAIDAESGALNFKQAPDFEMPIDADQDNVYEVEVKVDDGQGGTATQLINLTVLDINERPTIIYLQKIQENQKDVLTVAVTDEDMSMQQATISVNAGADRKLFAIDPKTGDLAFKTAPDFEHPNDADRDNIYEVEVKVEDDQGAFVVQSFRVQVIDVDEESVATEPE